MIYTWWAFNMLLESIHPQNQPGPQVGLSENEPPSKIHGSSSSFPLKWPYSSKKSHPLQTHQKTVQKIWPFPACIWIFRVRLLPAFGFSLRQLRQKGAEGRSAAPWRLAPAKRPPPRGLGRGWCFRLKSWVFWHALMVFWGGKSEIIGWSTGMCGE